MRKWVAVKVHPDTAAELDEKLNVTLSSPTSGYALGRSVGTGTVLDDDPTGGLEVGVAGAGIVEGDTGKARKVAFAVMLSAPTLSAVTVDYTIAGGIATSPGDFDDLSSARTMGLRSVFASDRGTRSLGLRCPATAG